MLSTLIPSAVVVGFSPIPVVELILVLFSRRRVGNALAFLTALIVLSAAVVAIGVYTQTGTESGAGQTRTGVTILLIALGVGLLGLAIREWRSRGSRSEPKIFSRIETMGPAAAASLGLGATILNPKNIIILLAAGQAIGASTQDSQLLVAALFVFVAMLPYVGTVTYALVGGEAARVRLDRLRDWLIAHNQTIMAIVCAVIGILLIVKNVGPL